MGDVLLLHPGMTGPHVCHQAAGALSASAICTFCGFLDAAFMSVFHTALINAFWSGPVLPYSIATSQLSVLDCSKIMHRQDGTGLSGHCWWPGSWEVCVLPKLLSLYGALVTVPMSGLELCQWQMKKLIPASSCKWDSLQSSAQVVHTE